MFCVLYFGLVMLRIELSHTFMDILVSVGCVQHLKQCLLFRWIGYTEGMARCQLAIKKEVGPLASGDARLPSLALHQAAQARP